MNEVPAQPPSPVHHTHVQTDFPPSRVIVEREQTSDRWHRVLNALYHDGVMAALRDREYRLLHVMLLLRQDDGYAYAPVSELMRLTGYTSARNIELARTALLGHPLSLLADAGRDRYQVLPGWSFAGRPTERTFVRTHVRDGPNERSENAHVRSDDDSRHRERARPTNQTKDQRQINPEDQSQEPGARAGGALVWWLGQSGEGDLFVDRAFRNGDVAGLLSALRVWAYMVEPLAAHPAITCERVMRVAAEVYADKAVVNKPVCLGKRLARELGVTLPPAPSRKSEFAAQWAEVRAKVEAKQTREVSVEEIERMAAERWTSQ